MELVGAVGWPTSRPKPRQPYLSKQWLLMPASSHPVGRSEIASNRRTQCSPLAHRGSPVQAIATIPEFIWELSLGIYLIVRGFKPSPIVTTDATEFAGVPPT
jgi:hypothetical protein